MTTKLLFFLSFFSGAIGVSQTINTFTSNPMTNFNIASSGTTINETPSGANATWTFNNLTASGSNTDTYAAPTPEQLNTYPGTTNVQLVTTEGGATSSFFLRTDASGTYITGISQGDIVLNYNTGNAFIGVFPMAFSVNNTGNVSGTFSYQDTHGTFTGTVTATVEAYGILNFNNNSGDTYSNNITRLKIDQTLNFSIPPIFNNIGTLTLTTYNYYDNTNNNLAFRTNTTQLVSSTLNLDETIELIEYNPDYMLGLSEENSKIDLIKLYPIPAQNTLYISDVNNKINLVSVLDQQGKRIFSRKTQNTAIDISKLTCGVYYVSLILNDGTQTNKRFIKQ